MDKTAGLAIERIERREHRAKVSSGQNRCKKALERCLNELQKEGFRIEGYFRVIENDTGIFLKTKR